MSGNWKNWNVIFRDWGSSAAKPKSASSAELPRSVRTVAAFLDAFGEYAFDLEGQTAEDVKRQCTQWARHFLDNEPPPVKTSPKRQNGPGQPEWDAVVKFFLQQRRDEHHYVTYNLADLRTLIWQIIEDVSSSIKTDQQSDAEMNQNLMRLREAVNSNSLEALRREALHVATTISSIVGQREARQRSQMQSLGARLKELTSELSQAKQEMSTDPLTKVGNRRSFDVQLERTVLLSLLSGQRACLMMLDLDRFKEINDRLGHAKGDAVLRQLADCCVSMFPRKTDFLARYGGDEFAIILPDTALREAQRLALRLLDAFAQTDFGTGDLQATVSIGLVELRAGEEAGSFLERADRALYQAKSNGRNRLIASE